MKRAFFVCLIAGLSCAAPMQSVQVDDEPPPPPPRFPTQGELAKLTDVPLDGLTAPPQTHEVESWNLVGPFDESWTPKPHPEDTKAQKLLVELSLKNNIETSASMACVAREVGSFFLEHEKYPAPALDAFIAGRCGAPVISVGIFTFGGTDVEKKVKEADLYGHWKDGIAKMITNAQKPDYAAGVWFGRKNKRALFFLATGPKKSTIAEVVTSTATQDRFTVRGKVLLEATSIRALINRGSFHVSVCTVNERIKLPAFEVECAADPKDSSAWIEIVAFPPGRILGPTVARIMVAPSGTPSNAYSRAKYGVNLDVDSPESVKSHLVTAVNRVRADAGLKPVVFEADQSTVAGSVARHYFASTAGKIDAHIAEVVVLGVRAGWDIPGMIRYGLFTAAASGLGGNVDDLLGSALERPFGREVLLDPAVRKIAIGPVWSPDERYFGAIISTYALFESEPQPELQKRVFDALSAARARAGFAAPGVLAPLDEPSQQIVAALEAKQLKPRAALRQLIEIAAQTLPGRRIGGWVLESTAIEEALFPPDLLTQPGLRIYTAVALHSTPEDPWARYVVLIVFESPLPVTTTML